MSKRTRFAVRLEPVRLSWLATALVVAGVTVAVMAAPAGAKVTGANGRIAFARADPASTEGDTFTFTANPDGGNPQPLFPGHHSGSPRWSPDGSEVAVISDAGLPCCTVASVIINPDTGGFRVLPMLDPDALFTACWVWSADGARLACESFGQTDQSLNGIYTIRSSDGGGLTRVTSNPGGDDIPIDYSPNGEQIVFARRGANGCDTKSALFVVNVGGSGVRRITPWGFCDDDGSWSPNGTEIAFEHRGSLFVVHPDGTDLAKIPLPIGSRSSAGDFSWSPDGKKIVFLLITPTSPPSGGPAVSSQNGIATANADGSGVQQVTNSPTFDHEADWGSHPITP